jgi:predicted  nucleic acid-binding Zn-ribbon protein
MRSCETREVLDAPTVARPNLTPHQAAFILERAVADRKLTQYDLTRYLRDLQEEVSAVEARLATLRAAAGHVATRAHEATASATKAATRVVRKVRRAVSPEVRASRKIQG